MSDSKRFSLLRDIRSWKVGDVVSALRNNGLDDCAEACQKRQVDGETLLGLSEFALRLWGRDLNVGNMRKLTSFIDDVNKNPEKYLIPNNTSNDDAWDTDWDDEPEDGEDRTEVLHRKKSKPKYVSQNGIPTMTNGIKLKQSAPDQNNTKLQGVNITSHVPKKLITPPIFDNPSVSNVAPVKVNGNKSKPLTSVRGQQTSNDKDVNSRRLKVVSPSSGQTQNNAVNDDKVKVLSELLSNHRNTVNRISEKEALHPTRGQQNGTFRDKKPLPPLSSTKPQLPARPPVSSVSKPSPPQPIVQLSSPPQPLLPQPPPSIPPPQSQHPIPQPLPSQPPLPQPPQSQPLLPQPPLPQPPLPKPPTTDSADILRDIIGIIPFEPDDYGSLDDDLLRDLHLKNQSVQISSSKGNYPPVETPPPVPSRKTSPVPLPVASGIGDKTSLTNISQLAAKLNQELQSRVPSPVINSGVHPGLQGQISENSSPLNEALYEFIPEHDPKTLDAPSLYTDGYLAPIDPSPPVPQLPPKPKVVLPEDPKQLPKVQKTDSGLWSSLRKKPQHTGTSTLSKPEKTPTPDGRKLTPTLPRPSYTFPTVPRPLPPTPDDAERPIKIPLIQMPWYLKVDRKKGEEILRNYGNGTFMIRPSTQPQNHLTLTLKYNERTFNIIVRLRPDGRYALGTEKLTEENFSSVEELVNHYMTSELALYSNGKPAGSVKLTAPPRKDNLFV